MKLKSRFFFFAFFFSIKENAALSRKNILSILIHVAILGGREFRKPCAWAFI